jgi:hypothetical protein
MRRQIEQAGRKLGRPRKHATNRERAAAQRQKAKETKLQLLADQFRLRVQDTNGGNWDEEDGWSCAENSIRLYTDLGTQPLTATFYSSILSPIPLGYVSGDIDAFVGFLHLCHDEHQPKSKSDSYLFSPAIFDPNKSTEENRGKENILYLRHVVLDFENGEVQPETLPNLFPDLQMVVTNTYRHPRANHAFGPCYSPTNRCLLKFTI